MPIDFEAEGLLEGLDPPAREARLELLEQLAAEGVPIEELRAACEDGRLPLLPVERVLEGGGPRYSPDEVAERAGLPREFLDRLWRALGMALADDDEQAYTDEDLEAAQRVKAFRDAGMSDEQIIEITRVMSRAMASVAASIGAAFTEAYLRAGDNERDLALRYAEASKALMPMLGPTLGHVLNIQQRTLTRQVAVDHSTLESGRLPGAQEIAVCFADLVDFTKLGENLEPAELGAVAERLEEMATELTDPPVRLVKTIGDAVMLASLDADALVDAALALVDAADSEPEGFPQLRAGVAHGEALGRAGDWFGRPVNLASRITGIARPGSVLASEDAKDALDGGYRCSFAGRRHIKGIDDEIALFRIRRAEPEDG